MGSITDTHILEKFSIFDSSPIDIIDSNSFHSFFIDDQIDADVPIPNDDDKFLDSIMKGLLHNEVTWGNDLKDPISRTDESIDEAILSDTFFEIDELNIFDSNSSSSNSISVLGVDINLYPNENIGNITNSDLSGVFNESMHGLDFDSSVKVNDVFAATFDYNLLEDNDNEPTEQLDIINMFPHMNNEKNRRRRSLLYENTCKFPKKTTTKINSNLDITKPIDPLLSHDYSQKEEKHFVCPITDCEKIYAKSSHLKAHLRRHSGEKPFVCNWQNCTWKFSRSDELARHKRSHSGIKPYKCDLCEKAFARSDHLLKHKKVHKKKMSQSVSYMIKAKSVAK